MDDCEKNYLLLLNLCVHVINAMKGEQIPSEFPWIGETQPTASKLFHHLGTAYTISKDICLPKNVGGGMVYRDISSLAVLIRTSFETYLTFNYLFVSPQTGEDKKYRHIIWELGDLLALQKYPPFEEENKIKYEENKKLIIALKAQLNDNPVFQKLSLKERQRALGKPWILRPNWTDLAVIAGMGKNFFDSNYSYLSSYAHTGHLSIFQLPQIDSEEIQSEFVNSFLLRGIFIMAHFICAYTSIYPKAQLVLFEYPEAAQVARTWNFTQDELD
jgi:hypothetical protein